MPSTARSVGIRITIPHPFRLTHCSFRSPRAHSHGKEGEIEIELDHYTGTALLEKVRAVKTELANGNLELWFARKRQRIGGGAGPKWTHLRDTEGPINGQGYIYRVTSEQTAETADDTAELQKHNQSAMFRV